MLTYCLRYTPSVNKPNSDFNLVYSDYKIHFKFKDYDKPKLICGFEDKLGYLISYITYYKFIKNQNYNVIDILNKLPSYLINNQIYGSIKLKLNEYRIEGFKPLLSSSKYNKTYPFGKIDEKCIPKMKSEDLIIENFLDTFKINLLEYLFNDKYEIVIYDRKDKNSYNKFIEKEERKQNKLNQKINYVKLW